MSPSSPLTLSAEDRGRVEEIQRLTRGGEGSIPTLLSLLGERSWAVRRTVVAALARVGGAAVPGLVAALELERGDEARIAAAMDALTLSSGDVEAALLALAARATAPAVLCDAVQVLGRRKSGRSIPFLAEVAVHPDDNVAVAAIEALGRIGGATAIEPLITAVRARSFFRTFPAIEVLGSSGDPRVVAPLAELLDDPVYATEAAASLGRTSQVAAVPALARVLGGASSGLAGAVVRALLDLRRRYEARFVDVSPIIRAFRQCLPAELAATRLLAALDDAGSDDAQAIACVLGWVEDPRVVPRLVALLDEGAAVADEATRALRGVGQEAEGPLLAALREGDSAHRLRLVPLVPAKRVSVVSLVACLDDPDPGVRSLACDALGRIGDRSVVRALFPRIADPDARVSQTAIAAVQSLGGAETEALALAAARAGDARMRRAALRVISYFGYPAGLGVLLEATADENDRIRDAATQGLAFIEEPRAREGLLRLAADPSAGTRAGAVRALGQTARVPDVVATLRARLGDDDAWVRYYACQALSRLGARECLEDVRGLTTDLAGQVRVAAVEALARLGGSEACHALELAAASPDADVRRAALTGLGSMRVVAALPVLLGALASGDAATRLIALAALEPLDAPEVFGAIVRATSDPDPGVHRTARTLMERREDPVATRWLIDQLRDEARHDWALGALAVPAERRLEEILSALEAADAVMAPRLVTVLTRMHRADGSAAVVSVLGFENVFARRAAASALVATDSVEARAALAACRDSDPDDDVRKIVAAAFT